ncbi:MAG: peptidoglycan-binding protein [Deltaproteobacteria bacterium]|nr:peptidoglycan-binding protein [Deltaproteobacteria bacterium]
MTVHRVQSCQDLETIARHHRVSRSEIWSAPENAALRESRPDPGILREGDEVFVPQGRPPCRVVNTGAAHRFMRVVPTTELRLRFEQGSSPRARAGLVYAIDGAQQHTSELDAEGTLRIQVPRDAREVVVRLYPDTEIEETYTMAIRDLDPADEVRGARQRLVNLGFGGGDPGDDLDDEAQSALRRFQFHAGCRASGSLDAETLDALRRMHRA